MNLDDYIFIEGLRQLAVERARRRHARACFIVYCGALALVFAYLVWGWR